MLTLGKEDPRSSRLLVEFGIQGGYKGTGPTVIVLDGHGERLDSFNVYAWAFPDYRLKLPTAPRIVDRITKSLAYAESIDELERCWRRDVTNLEAFEDWSKRMTESEQQIKLFEACNALYEDPQLPEEVRDALTVQRQLDMTGAYVWEGRRQLSGEDYTTLDEILDGKTLLADIGSRISNRSQEDGRPESSVLKRLFDALALDIKKTDGYYDEIYQANKQFGWQKPTQTYPLGTRYFDASLVQKRKGQAQVLLLTSDAPALGREIPNIGAFLSQAASYRDLCKRANIFHLESDEHNGLMCARLAIPRGKPWVVVLDGHGERLDSFEADFPAANASRKNFADKIVARIEAGLAFKQSTQELERRWRSDVSNSEAFAAYANRMEESSQQAALFRACNAIYNEPNLSADVRHALADRRLLNRKYSALSIVLPDKNAQQIKPTALGATKSVPPEKLKEIQAELVKRRQTDQAVRKDPARQADETKVDAENTGYVVGLLNEFGWIDAQRFGLDASNTAFLIVQHSGNLPLMLAALPEIEKDLKSGRLADGQPYALLYDRTKIFLGEKQRFGTQIGSDLYGNLIVLPLEDRTRVEQFRKEIGVSPLSEYLKICEQSGKKIKFADE